MPLQPPALAAHRQGWISRRPTRRMACISKQRPGRASRRPSFFSDASPQIARFMGRSDCFHCKNLPKVFQRCYSVTLCRLCSVTLRRCCSVTLGRCCSHIAALPPICDALAHKKLALRGCHTTPSHCEFCSLLFTIDAWPLRAFRSHNRCVLSHSMLSHCVGGDSVADRVNHRQGHWRRSRLPQRTGSADQIFQRTWSRARALPQFLQRAALRANHCARRAGRCFG